MLYTLALEDAVFVGQGQARRGRHRPAAEVWAGLPNPGERILCGCPSELTPSRASFCRFLFPLAGSSQSQSFSVSFSLPVG